MPGATHGLAADIRAAQDNETFDLGGMNEASIASTFEAAFREPLEASTACQNGTDLIRLTFVVGAGKQARQKYDANAAKAVTSALQSCGYEQDKAASGVVECAGTYKMQHDTGKNLKTVVVYPKVTGTAGGAGDQTSGASVLGTPDSPRYKLCVSSLAVFQTMIASKCPSWTQKKRAMMALDSVKNILDECNNKLLTGAPLTDAETEVYEGVVDLEGKRTWLQSQMQSHVTDGKLTTAERDRLLQQNSEKISSLEKDGKKVPPALLQRKEKLSAITDANAFRKQPLKHQAAINKLLKELKPLEQMEQNASKGGKLLSLKETKQLARKDDILEEIEKLTLASKGWFEEDENDS